MDTSIEERFNAAVNVIRGLPKNGNLFFILHNIYDNDYGAAAVDFDVSSKCFRFLMRVFHFYFCVIRWWLVFVFIVYRPVDMLV